MTQVVRNTEDSPWTEEEAESYARNHGYTVVMINGHTLWLTK